MSLRIVNVLLDLSLVGASIWMVFIVRGIGGLVGKTLTIITIGAIVLGLAHISETAFDYFWPAFFAGDVGEFVHRSIVVTGFILLVFGFRQIRELK
jgi:hypothetical protein